MKTKRPIGNQRNFRGRLVGIEGEEVIFDDKTTGRVRIALDAIAKANLEVDFEAGIATSGSRRVIGCTTTE